MSQMDAADESFSEVKSQESTRDMSSCGQEPQESTGDMSYFGQKPQVITRLESSVDPEPQESTRDKSTVEPEPQETTRDKSSVDPKPQVITRDKSSVEPASQENTRDISFGEPEIQGNTGDKSSVVPETQESIKDQSSVEPVAQETTKDISSSDPDLQENIRDMSSDNSEQRENTRNKSSDELEPQESTTNTALADVKSQENTTGLGKPQSPVSTTDKSSGEEKSADISVQSQESTIDMSFGAETSQENVKNKAKEIPLCEQEPQTVPAGDNLTVGVMSFGEEKSQVHITEKASGASTTDKSMVQPESQESNIDKSTSKQEPQIRSIAEQEYQNGEPSEGTSIHSGARPKTSTYSGKVETEMGAIDRQSSREGNPKVQITESQENNKDNFSYREEFQESELKYRKPTHSGAKPESSPYSDKSPSQMDTAGNFGDGQSQGSSRKHYEPQSKATDTGVLLWSGAIIALLVLVLGFFLSREPQSPDHKDSPADIFFKEFASLKNDFPGQYEGLWFRSEKLLQKHINMSDPSAPSILILTAARDGEHTLRCVSKRIAKSYADSFSKSWLMVNGLSKSKYDSATSKLQIDNELSSGFQSNSRAAVLYRLETLPPGSLLILYKYCDHENAAFKNVALVFTVLLEEQSLETDLSFTEVEEKVKDLLWERFASSEVGAHNEMDVDKLSGVWSRISHVVLPVLPVASIEIGSCPGIED